MTSDSTYQPTIQRRNQILGEADRFASIAIEQWDLGGEELALKAAQVAQALGTVATALATVSVARKS